MTRKCFWSTVWLRTPRLQKCTCDSAVVPNTIHFSASEACVESHLRKRGWCKQLQTIGRRKRVNMHILKLETDPSRAIVIAWWHRIILSTGNTHTHTYTKRKGRPEKILLPILSLFFSPSSVKLTHSTHYPCLLLCTHFFSHRNPRSASMLRPSSWFKWKAINYRHKSWFPPELRKLNGGLILCFWVGDEQSQRNWEFHNFDHKCPSPQAEPHSNSVHRSSVLPPLYFKATQF